MPKEKREGAVTRWAFTYFLEYPPVSSGWRSARTDPSLKTQVKAMKRFLKAVATSWTFQLERAPTTSTLHFQGRLTLKVRMRRSQIQAKLVDYCNKAAHWSREVAGGEEASSDYCSDPEKRAPGQYSGPWTSSSAKPYIPPQFRGKPNAFQQEVIERLKNQNTRQILAVVDERGNIGKSWLSGFLGSRGEGLTIPASVKDSNALLQYVHSFVTADPAKQWTIILDVPRSMEQRDWPNWLAAIESIKNGVVHDLRYHGRVTYFHWPKLVIFTNAKPPEAHLSSDRWDFWEPTDAPQVSAAATQASSNQDNSDSDSEDEPPQPVQLSQHGSQWTDSQLNDIEARYDQDEIDSVVRDLLGEEY